MAFGHDRWTFASGIKFKSVYCASIKQNDTIIRNVEGIVTFCRVSIRISLALAFILFALPGKCYAKSNDASPVTESGLIYRSNGNDVEALDSLTNARIWRTELFKSMDPLFYNPWIEADIQWRIVWDLKIDGNTLIAQESKGHRYILEKSTGKLLRVEREFNGQIIAFIGACLIFILSSLFIAMRKYKKLKNQKYSTTGA